MIAFTIIEIDKFLRVVLVCSMCLIFGVSNAPGQTIQTDSVMERLIQTIQETDKYDAEKLYQIGLLEDSLHLVEKSDLRRLYKFNTGLFRQYEAFNYDSAFIYAVKSQQFAYQLKDPFQIASAKVNFGQICVSAGMYKEALDTLQTIHTTGLPREILSLYYGLLGRCYGEMAEYNNFPDFSDRYDEFAATYRDSALILTDEGTFFNSFLKAFIKSQKGDISGAGSDLKKLLNNSDMGLRDFALVNYVLGDLSFQAGQQDSAIIYWAEATIADIKSSTKETLAIIRLANLLFNIGDTKNASTLIRKANEDALYYGARQRKIQIVAILPFIEQQVIQKIEVQKQRLYLQSLIVTILLIFVIVLAFVIYRQMTRLRKAKAIIAEANENLQIINQQLLEANQNKEEQNAQLQKINLLLLEANKIKEEYIGNFFIKDSVIFDKFQTFISKIDKKLKEQTPEEVCYFVQSYDPEREKEELLTNFDKVFMQLFPDFINEFNSLFNEEDHIQLKKGELLNMELRIFALIRLGITHNEKIAQILGYS
nr:hypothetical protein [Bacteroidota bacterium]